MTPDAPAALAARLLRLVEHPSVRIAVPVLITAIAVSVLHRLASDLHWADVKADIAQSAPSAIALAVLWTAVSFAALSVYDMLSVRSVARGVVPNHDAGVIATSWIAFLMG